jgi:hypothetical protein
MGDRDKATPPIPLNNNIISATVPNVQVQPVAPPVSPPVNVNTTMSSQTTDSETTLTVSSSNPPSQASYGSIPYNPPSDSKKSPLPRDPRSWTSVEVRDWLASKELSEDVIQAFQTQRITGRSLIDLSKDDLSAIGVQTYGDKLELVRLIRELKAAWSITTTDATTEVGSSNGVGMTGVASLGGWSGVVKMEDGKGAPMTDAPPSYSA